MQDIFISLSELGARLRQLRLRAGLTQQELAARFETIGKSYGNTISRLENGLLPRETELGEGQPQTNADGRRRTQGEPTAYR